MSADQTIVVAIRTVRLDFGQAIPCTSEIMMLSCNRLALAQTDPEFLAFLVALSRARVEQPTRSGEHRPWNSAAGDHENGRSDDDATDPELAAFREVAAFGVLPAENLLCVGFGQGHQVRELVNHLGPYGRLTVVLLDALRLVPLLERVDLSDVLSDERCRFVFGSLDSLARRLECLLSDSPRMFVLGTGVSAVDPDLRPLLQRIEGRRSEEVRRASLGPLLRENWQRNIGWIGASHGIDDVRAACEGRPGIVVAAGPSLDHDTADLQRFQGRAPLIVVDTAARRLVENGTTPDVIVISDPYPASLQHFEELDETLPLAFLPAAAWSVIDRHRGPKWVAFHRGDRLAEALDELWLKGRVLVGGTVSILAIEVARRLGCDPVVLVGLDLALTDGRRHCSSARSQPPSQQRFSVPSVDSTMVETTDVLDDFRRQVEARIAQEPGVAFIDVKRGGAMIAGAQRSGLRQVWADYAARLAPIRNPFAAPIVAQKAPIPDEITELWHTLLGTELAQCDIDG
jgi:hypothetical protein